MAGSKKSSVEIVPVILAILLLIVLVGSARWGGPGMGRTMGPGMMGYGQAVPPVAPSTGTGPDWPLAFLVVVPILLIIAGLLVWLAPARAGSSGKTKPRESPLEIAKRRYVSGEITLPEYEEILNTLTEGVEPYEAWERHPTTRALK